MQSGLTDFFYRNNLLIVGLHLGNEMIKLMKAARHAKLQSHSLPFDADFNEEWGENLLFKSDYTMS